MCASDAFKKNPHAPWRMAAALTTLLMAITAVHAEGNDREQEQVRRLKLQLRQVQQQQEAAVHDTRAKADAEKAELSRSLKSAQGEASAQRQAAGAAGRRIRALNDELDAARKDKDALSAELARLRQTLEDTRKTAGAQNAQAAQTIAGWQGRYEILSEAHSQCRTHNADLYKLGTELLARYENKGMSEVLGGAEPFTQLSRVKLENMKAAYQDKLDAAQVRPALANTMP